MLKAKNLMFWFAIWFAIPDNSLTKHTLSSPERKDSSGENSNSERDTSAVNVTMAPAPAPDDDLKAMKYRDLQKIAKGRCMPK